MRDVSWLAPALRRAFACAPVSRIGTVGARRRPVLRCPQQGACRRRIRQPAGGGKIPLRLTIGCGWRRAAGCYGRGDASAWFARWAASIGSSRGCKDVTGARRSVTAENRDGSRGGRKPSPTHLGAARPCGTCIAGRIAEGRRAAYLRATTWWAQVLQSSLHSRREPIFNLPPVIIATLAVLALVH